MGTRETNIALWTSYSARKEIAYLDPTGASDGHALHVAPMRTEHFMSTGNKP